MLIYVNTYYRLLGLCATDLWCPDGDIKKRGSLCPSFPFCFYQVVQIPPLVRKLLQPVGIVIIEAKRHHLL